MIKSHICWLKDDLDGALEEMHQAVALNPKEPRFYHFRGKRSEPYLKVEGASQIYLSEESRYLSTINCLFVVLS